MDYQVSKLSFSNLNLCLLYLESLYFLYMLGEEDVCVCVWEWMTICGSQKSTSAVYLYQSYLICEMSFHWTWSTPTKWAKWAGQRALGTLPFYFPSTMITKAYHYPSNYIEAEIPNSGHAYNSKHFSKQASHHPAPRKPIFKGSYEKENREEDSLCLQQTNRVCVSTHIHTCIHICITTEDMKHTKL